MIVLEKSRINIWTIGGLIITVVVNSFCLGIVYNRMTNNDEYFKKEIALINNTVSAIPQIRYELSRASDKILDNKNDIERVNARTDEVVTSFAGKLDQMAANINKMTVQLEVLNTKFTEREKAK